MKKISLILGLLFVAIAFLWGYRGERWYRSYSTGSTVVEPKDRPIDGQAAPSTPRNSLPATPSNNTVKPPVRRPNTAQPGATVGGTVSDEPQNGEEEEEGEVVEEPEELDSGIVDENLDDSAIEESESEADQTDSDTPDDGQEDVTDGNEDDTEVDENADAGDLEEDELEKPPVAK